MRTTTTKLPFDDLLPIFKEVASVAELSNMSPDDYNQYMDVIDYYRTTRAAYDMDRQKSYAKGLNKGMTEGIAKGKAKLLRCVALFRLSLYNAHKKPSYSTIDEEKYP